jgi:hypothetical protein
LKKSGIFIPSEVRNKFYELDALMWDALVEHRVNKEVGQIPLMNSKVDAFRSQGTELLNGLERVVQRRLWNPPSLSDQPSN